MSTTTATATSSATLNIRLVPKGFTAVPDPRALPTKAVPFVWSEHERLWRSVEPLFVTAAKREGAGAYRAVSELADGPFYHTALRIPGSASDDAATLQARLDTELLQLVAPQRWACADCQRDLKKEKGAGPCARHQKEMPPAVLYKTTHPRVNRLGQYYIFGWARDFESTTPIAEHNDETWSPTVEAAAAEHEALREADRLAAEARMKEQSAYDSLSSEEKKAALDRALFGGSTRWAAEVYIDGENQRLEHQSREAAEQALIGIAQEELGRSFTDYTEAREALMDSDRVAWADVSTIESDATCPNCGNLGGWDQERGECAPCGHVLGGGQTASWAAAPKFTPEQQLAINAFIGGHQALSWLERESNRSGSAELMIETAETIGYIYGAFGHEGRFKTNYGPFDADSDVLPETRPTVDQAIDKLVATFEHLLDLLTCDEYEEVEGLLLAFGREREAAAFLRAHALVSESGTSENRLLEHCFDGRNEGGDLASLVANGVETQTDHQRRILALYDGKDQEQASID